jgi:hypothetical protein
MKKISDYKYFKEHILLNKKGEIFCGEYGICTVCGKKSREFWIALGMINQFHFCSKEHYDLFINSYIKKKIL